MNEADSKVNDTLERESRIIELRLKHTRWRLTSWLQPHEYIAEPDAPEELWVERVMQERIEALGYWDTHGSYRNKYLEIDGYRYWKIGRVLNRERLPISEPWPESNR